MNFRPPALETSALPLDQLDLQLHLQSVLNEDTLRLFEVQKNAQVWNPDCPTVIQFNYARYLHCHDIPNCSVGGTSNNNPFIVLQAENRSRVSGQYLQQKC